MSSLEAYVMRIKPAIDSFIRDPTNDTLTQVEQEIKEFNFGQMRIYQVQILVPLIIKLDELTGVSQELRTSLLNCLRQIISKLYLSEEKGLRSILVVVLKQIQDSNSAKIRPNLSEEIKLATVLCIIESLKRSTSDVLEAFYTKEQAVIIGQILLTLLELIQHEKYRILVNAALQCLMVVFYVHDESDVADVVLRNQVANTIFLFLPKVVTVLYKTAMGDEKVGETIRMTAIKSLGRIICIMFEETTDESVQSQYDAKAFRALSLAATDEIKYPKESSLLGNAKACDAEMENRLQQLQADLRSQNWITETSKHLRPIFVESKVLSAHDANSVRQAYAEICCLLLKRCPINLQQNFVHVLESVVALSEDKEQDIANLCGDTLNALQQLPGCEGIFDENAELLLDVHLNKWPRILHRCDDNEQFAELLFFKGFLRNVKSVKLQLFLLIPKNLEKFVMCLLATVVLQPTQDMLNEDYSLRYIQDSCSEVLIEYDNLPWRQFKHLSTARCVNAFYDICAMLGGSTSINRIIFDYVFELIERRSTAMNEAILLLILLTTSLKSERKSCDSQIELTELLLGQLFDDEHWNLSLQPDALWRLKADKPTSWLMDRTPGLYESAVEVRTQDYDSDDEYEQQLKDHVSISDAQLNILHTCLVLDALGHCALFLGNTFEKHIVRSLHRVLLKLSNSNTIIQCAANFAFMSMQVALGCNGPTDFIARSLDYIIFHLNMLLKRSPNSSAAVDILTLVLQFSTRENVPHLSSIFQTIHEECIKSHQKDNVHSYLRVYIAFLCQIDKWQSNTLAEIYKVNMQVESDNSKDDVLSTWLAVLNKQHQQAVYIENDAMPSEYVNTGEATVVDKSQEETTKPTLPQHIEIIKQIIGQALKFVSSSEQVQQILALECLATGVPLLADYENELLPLVHLIWEPLMEKFRQKDSVVLYRCFTLLHVLAVHVKNFILKRSLSDVIPQLKQFLMTASTHSKTECSIAQTQEYKLQVKLLQQLADFIQSLQLDGKHFYELLNIAGLYLSQAQPKKLQTLAVELHQKLTPYNGPFVYVTLLQRAHLKDYKVNISAILCGMGFQTYTNMETSLS